MINNQDIEKRIQKLSLNFQIEIKPTQLFTEFISNDLSDKILLKNLKNKQSTACGKTLKKGDLLFQCLTCANDKAHLFCADCFDVKLHQNHKCFLKKDEGFCDCGDDILINQNGFCSKHKGFNNLELNQELEKVPITLQQKIEQFIMSISQVYFDKMKQIQQQYLKHNSTLLQLYHQTQIKEYDQLMLRIQKSYKVQEYYQLFQQAIYFYKLLFSLIDWLIQDRLCMTIFISQIFQKQIGGNQSILEELFDYQVLIETQSPLGKFYILQNILNKFHRDHSFKFFFYKVLINKYHAFRLFVPQLKHQLQVYINQVLERILETKNNQLSYDCIEEYDWYFESKAHHYHSERTKLTKLLFQSELCQYLFQAVSDDWLTYFFQKKQFNKILEGNSRHITMLNYTTIFKTKKMGNYGSIFYYNEDKFLETILDQQIQDSLSNEDYKLFSSQKLDATKLISIDLNQLLLVNMIKSWLKIKTRKSFNIENEYFDSMSSQFFDLGYYMKEISDSVHFFCCCIKYFKTQKYSQEYHDNIINLLFQQCYNSIKRYKNTGKSVVEKIKDAYNKYIQKNIENLKNKQVINRYTRILFLAFKSDTIFDKVFIFFLTYIYNHKQFQESQVLLSFITNLLLEETLEFKNQLFKILERCVVSLVAMNYHRNENLNKVYNGVDLEIFTTPQSYDIAFIRLYLYFFKDQGLRDLKNLITQVELISYHPELLKMPNTHPQFLLECQILQNIFGGELDMINICGSFFQELPPDLHISFAKLVANIFVQQNTMEYVQLVEQLNVMKIQECFLKYNNYQNILNLCILDQSKVYLTLNPKYTTTLDRNLLSENPNLLNEILGKLIQKQASQTVQYFGDGVQWDISYFSSPYERKMLKEILQFYCSYQFIDENIQIIKDLNIYFSQACQLLHTQIVSANYFRKQEFKAEAELIIEELKKILQKIKQRNMKQQLSTLINFVQQLISQKEQQNVQQDSIQKTNKQRYKEKFKAKQQTVQLQNQLDQIEQENVENAENLNECAACRQQFQNSNIVSPVLIFRKPIINSINILPKAINSFIQSQMKENIGMQVCKHQFHSTCIEEYFNVLQIECENDSLPEWLTLNCPTCKHPCNFILPIHQSSSTEISITNNKFISFFSRELKLQKIEDIKVLYYQLLLDLLIQIFINPKEFEQMMKHKVFQSIFQLLINTEQNSYQQKKRYFQLQPDDSFILQLFFYIEQLELNEIDQNQFKNLITNCISECQELQIQNVLKITFQIDTLSNCEQSQQIQELIHFNQIVQKVEIQIENLLGSNFDVFHKRYFPKCCNVCNFFNRVQRMSYDIYVCLFCLKQFCKFNCNKLQEVGNLNYHALTDHNGVCVYMSVNTGSNVFLASPISKCGLNTMYYDKVGYEINLENEAQNEWSYYEICTDGLHELSKAIVNNNYLKILRAQMVDPKYFDSFGQH